MDQAPSEFLVDHQQSDLEALEGLVRQTLMKMILKDLLKVASSSTPTL